MNSPVPLHQNEPQNIELLRASTVAYRKAKYGEIWFTYSMLVLSAAFPIAYFLIKNENVKIVLFACSFLLTFLIEIFAGAFKGNTSKGAIFKELFDTKVFGLPWKRTLERPPQSEVLKYSQQYAGPEIKDWYSPNISTYIKPNIAVAILQYSNTSWDIDLRKSYRSWIVIFLASYLLALMLLTFALNIDWLTLFLLLYSLHSFFTHFISLARGHSEVIRKREAISKHLDEIIQNMAKIGKAELRDIQDEIYLTRQEAAKVPDLFFRFYKDRLNSKAEEYIQQINQRYETNSN